MLLLEFRPAADFTLGFSPAARAGEFAVTDPLLENVVRHRPLPVRACLEGVVATPAGT
jgi:hypothetical protein